MSRLNMTLALQRLVEVVDDLGVVDVVEVAALDQAGVLEHPLDLLGAVLGQDDALLLLVDLVIARRRSCFTIASTAM